jgi:rRNA maturation endonuclease Nob1
MTIMASKPIFDDVAPWPEKPAPAATHIGHNRPPLDELIPEEFRTELLREKPEFLTKLHDLVEAANRAQAVDDDTLGRCGNLVNAYRACANHIDATHKAVKQPYLDGGRLVDGEKNALRGQVDAARAKVEGIANAFTAKRDAELRAERERIAAEQRAAAAKAAAAEAERERAERAAIAAAEFAERARIDAEKAGDAEALAKANADVLDASERADAAAIAAEVAMAEASFAPALPDKIEPVRSDEGALVSSKQEWRSEVTDYTLAFMACEDNPKVREAIDKAIAGLVRAGKRQIDGCKIWPVAKANFR